MRKSDVIFESFSPEQTFEFSRKLAEDSKPGDVYCLSGDLGTGKTLFSKGFAKGLEITEEVVSPTFTIVHEYKGRLPLYHFDVYRILDGDGLYDIGFDEYVEGSGVCLIEWADQLREEMPPEAIWISIEKDPSKGTDYRKITVS